MKQLKMTILAASVICVSCAEKRLSTDPFITENIAFAQLQLSHAIANIEASGEVRNPVTTREDGSVLYCSPDDWRSGFFPGTVWYLYELTQDSTLLPLAQKYTLPIEKVKSQTWHHDVGFMVGCSFGNGYRLTKSPAYRDVLIEAARSLSTRFREKAGVLQSWDANLGWQAKRGWECPVIIDNLMNLELLFAATRLTGDSSFYQIAVSHANRTMKEHFRTDGSSYHVIDYSLTDGSVRNRHTAQGYAHESTWARGQAWAIYGYTLIYRETGDKKYLNQALQSFKFMKNHVNMPTDLIPYWDMNAPDIPNEFRDASSAAVMASALYEISTFDIPDASSYKTYADRMMASLASPAYRAEAGKNGYFLLKHSVGSIPHQAEVDVPLNYTDYYFLEALKRKREIETN